MSAATILPDDEVCACLSETGERNIRLYERCQRCGSFMEADYLSEELHALEQRNEQLERALQRISGMHLDSRLELNAAIGRARMEMHAIVRAALAAGSTGDAA